MQYRIKLVLVTLAVFVLSGCFPSNDLTRQEYLMQGKTMGTTYNIKVVGENIDTVKLQQGIDDKLKQLNQEMSTYIKDSELSRFLVMAQEVVADFTRSVKLPVIRVRRISL